MGRKACPVVASQSRSVPSLPAVRMVLPSGLNATAMTEPGCSEGWPMGWPVAASQSRAVLIRAAGEDGLAVGAERHGPDLAFMHQGDPMGWPVAASQSRAVLSALPVRRSCRRG